MAPGKEPDTVNQESQPLKRIKTIRELRTMTRTDDEIYTRVHSRGGGGTL